MKLFFGIVTTIIMVGGCAGVSQEHPPVLDGDNPVTPDGGFQGPSQKEGTPSTDATDSAAPDVASLLTVQVTTDASSDSSGDSSAPYNAMLQPCTRPGSDWGGTCPFPHCVSGDTTTCPHNEWVCLAQGGNPLSCTHSCGQDSDCELPSMRCIGNNVYGKQCD